HVLDDSALLLCEFGQPVDLGPAQGAEVRIPEGQSDDRVLLRSEEHTSELQSRFDLVCRLLLEKKKRAQRCLRVAVVPARAHLVPSFLGGWSSPGPSWFAFFF